tara:strand:+ start:120 stop:476 length:357 start_codon:yes stop_codon:yes gene_type:complete
MVSSNIKTISFYYWDTTTHAINPNQLESIPVDGLLWVERHSATKLIIYYNGRTTIELLHGADPAHRVINGFKRAINLARTSNSSAPVTYDLPIPEKGIINPPIPPPPIYVSSVLVKAL